ncbi:MAG: ASKHA domain-containing protein [Verrucomicrobiaceae bacterium]|nr:ASKHA domain-containing protein [Verrucomicrobiaceae bacterium]
MPVLTLHPLGRTLEVTTGAPLQDVLFEQGVEFPCGGGGKCKGCRIKVLRGELPVTDADETLLTANELADGWRLACQAEARDDLVIELAQWEAPILSDDSTFAFTPRGGLGVAVDLGTTTIAVQLLDLRTGNVVAVRTALNAQARHGADIMSRLEFAIREGTQPLTALVREQIGGLIESMIDGCDASSLRDVVIVGNSAMHHLFCGLDIEPLAYDPFEPHDAGLKVLRAMDLGWGFIPDASVRFLPCLGGFVGSDLLAGILATRLHESAEPVALVDLGTNGEIVVGNRDRILCCSTAAGPAFEGARISMGMRASTGAISEVHVQDGRIVCHVLGGAEPRGLCGSGLVDAVAACLELGPIVPSGRMMTGNSVMLAPPVVLTQGDVRELQLAKGAIAAGLELLAEQLGAALDDLHALHLAGAFGNYINRTSARRIGLLNVAADRIRPVGNSALLGAKMALFDLPREDGSFTALLGKVRHVPLNEHPRFQDVYVDNMGFPKL